MRIEVLQVVHTLAHANLQHRKLKLVAHGKRDAALRRAVELGDDDAVKRKRIVELARLLQAVLAGRRIDDEHGVDRQLRALAHDVHDLLELAHKVGRGVQATCSVNEHQIRTRFLRALDCGITHARGVTSPLTLDHFDIGAASPDLELLDRGGAEGVGAAQDNVAARIGGFLGKLADGRRLARAVDAHEEHERGVAAEDLFPTIGERARNLLVQHIEHGIGIGKRLARRLVAQVLHDGARCRSADIA